VPGSLPGTTYTETTASYAGASFSSGKQCKASTILTGTLKVATTCGGEFILVTLKK
jgi:hypothetical protein